jgi:hypothetical protein
MQNWIINNIVKHHTRSGAQQAKAKHKEPGIEISRDPYQINKEVTNFITSLHHDTIKCGSRKMPCLHIQ